MKILVAGWQALTDIELVPLLTKLHKRGEHGENDPLIEGSVNWFWVKALKNLGHEVRFFDHTWPRILARERLLADPSLYEDLIRARRGDLTIAKRDAERMRAALLDEITRFRPELIITHQAERFDADFLRSIPRRPPLATWVGVDPTLAARHDWMKSLYAYDLVVSAVRSVTQKLTERAVRTLSLSFAFDPETHRPTSQANETRDTDIGIVGTHKFPRRRMLRRLVQEISGLKLGIWGRRWPNDPVLSPYFRGPAWHQETARAIGRMKMHLNIPQVTAEEDINMRCFETAGAGTPLISLRQESLLRHFEEEKEVIVYDDIEDLIEKTRLYLDHPDELARIALAARTRALREYTYEKRFEEILKAIS